MVAKILHQRAPDSAVYWFPPRWHHQMETFSALLALCVGNSPVTGESLTKASDAELWCFLWSVPEQTVWVNNRDNRLFEMTSRSLWRHSDGPLILQCIDSHTNRSGGRFKNTYELLNLRALKISKLHKNHIFQCMGKIFCVEFQRVPLKFHTKYLTHTLKDVNFIHIWKFKSS